MSNSYCAIMTKEEVNVIKESLELCMYAIASKMSSVGFNEGYNSKHYYELYLNYTAYKTILTDIENMMKYNEDK